MSNILFSGVELNGQPRDQIPNEKPKTEFEEQTGQIIQSYIKKTRLSRLLFLSFLKGGPSDLGTKILREY